jgi:hypothetical protein
VPLTTSTDYIVDGLHNDNGTKCKYHRHDNSRSDMVVDCRDLDTNRNSARYDDVSWNQVEHDFRFSEKRQNHKNINPKVL